MNTQTKINRFLSSIISIILVIMMLPISSITAYAAEPVIGYSKEIGEYRYYFGQEWTPYMSNTKKLENFKDSGIKGWGVSYCGTNKNPSQILNELDGYPIVSIDYTFDRADIQIPPDLSNLTHLYKNRLLGTFRNCTYLTQTTKLPSNVTEVIDLYNGCIKLTDTGEIPDRLESCSSMFYGCTNLIKADEFPPNVKNINYMYSGCKNLSIDVSNLKSIENMRGAFSETQAYGNPVVNDKIKGYSVEDAFYMCQKLDSLTVTLDQIESNILGLSAESSKKLEFPIIILCDKAVTTEQISSMASKFKGNVEFRGDLRLIPDNLFDRFKFASVKLPDTIEKIGKGAFKNTVINDIDLSKTKITTIEDELFLNSYNLKNIGLNNSIVSVGGLAFHGTNISEINIPNVESIGVNAFSNSSITKLNFPKLKLLGEMAFKFCYNLESVNIKQSEVTVIPSNCFDSCKNLKNIELPDRLNSVKEYAFNGCTSLTNLTIPNSVQSIGANAFNGCTSLTNLTIPKSVQSIGVDAFKGMTSPVYVYANTPAEAYCKANSVSYLLKEEVLPSGISIEPSTDQEVYVGDTINFKGSVRPSNVTDPTITWDSSNTTVGTIASNGEFKALSAGTTYITGSCGSKNAEVKVIVKEKEVTTGITLNKQTLTIHPSETFQFEATVEPNTAYDKKVSYKSSDTAVGTVNDSGLFSALALGKTTITATNSGGQTATCEVNVVEKTPDVLPTSIVAPDKITVLEGASLALNYEVKPDEAANKEVTLESRDINIATISKSGLVSGVGAGETDIVITSIAEPTVTKTVHVRVKEIGSSKVDITINNNTSNGTEVSGGDNIFGDVTVNVEVKFTVEDKTAEAPNKAEIEATLPKDAAIHSYYDMSLQKSEDSKPFEEVTELVNPLTIKMNVPTEIQNKTDIGIVRVHDGKAEIIPSELLDNKTKIQFNSTKFSTYAIVYSDTSIGNVTSEDRVIEIEGTIEPKSSSSDGLISLIVPTKLTFIIDGDRNFVTGDYNFENTGETDLEILVKSVDKTAGTTVDLVDPDKHTDWTTLDKATTLKEIGLKLGTTKLNETNIKLLDLNSKIKESLKLTGYYGHDWGNESNIVLKYNLTLEINTK